MLVTPTLTLRGCHNVCAEYGHQSSPGIPRADDLRLSSYSKDCSMITSRNRVQPEDDLG